MTVEEARKILGTAFDTSSDEEIEKVIYLITGLCNRIIDTHLAVN